MSRPAAVVSDDHELFRVALAGILTSQLDFGSVLQTSTLDEALERLGDTPNVTLALFDLSMPGMVDANSLRAVRDVFPEVRVAVVTGSTRREDILLALSAGVHGFVPKTLRLPELSKALQTIVAGGIYVPPSLAGLPSGPDDQPARAPGASRPEPAVVLTSRQREVLALIAAGCPNKEIARRLRLGAGTVKVHVAAVLRALGVANRAGAAAAAATLLQDGRDGAGRA